MKTLFILPVFLLLGFASCHSNSKSEQPENVVLKPSVYTLIEDDSTAEGKTKAPADSVQQAK